MFFLDSSPILIDITKIKDFCASLWRMGVEAWYYVFKLPVLPIANSLGSPTFTFFNPFSNTQETIIFFTVPNYLEAITSPMISLLQMVGIDLTFSAFDLICSTGIIVIIMIGVIRWFLDILP